MERAVSPVKMVSLEHPEVKENLDKRVQMELLALLVVKVTAVQRVKMDNLVIMDNVVPKVKEVSIAKGLLLQ